MNDAHRNILRSNLVELVKNLVLDEIFIANLESERILTTIMVEELDAIKEKSKKNSHFVSNILPRRGPRAFDIFIKTLMLTGQDWIAEELDFEAAKRYRGLMPRTTKKGQPLHPPSNEQNQPVKPPKSTPSSFFNPQPTDRLITLGGHDMPFIPINIDDVDSNEAYSLICNTDEVYKMDASPRGRCIIINNTIFTNMSERNGSNFDAVNLSELFRKLDFSVDIWSEVTAKEIVIRIDTERQNPDNADYDCLVVCVLSHGNRGVIYGIDTEKVSVEEELMKPFDSIHCPRFAGKPKIFLIQACQGDDVTVGASPQADGPSVGDSEIDNKEEDEKLMERLSDLQLTDDPDSVPVIANTHEKADMLLAYSTVPGYKSWRRPDLGSWFMRDIVSVFSAYAHKKHILDMLTVVGKKISDRQVATKGFVQINETRSTLRKNLYFFPGYQSSS